MPAIEINFLAVLAAALAAFFLGALWYSPLLFAKQWVSAHGYSEEQLKEMQKGAKRAYAVSLVCFVVMALAIAVIVHYTKLVAPVQGLKLGLLVWVGFAATLGLISNVFYGKRLAAFFIDAGYQLVYLLLMGVIIASWH